VLFNSLEFAAFATVTLVLYWTLRLRGQNALLLIASYLFYSAWDWRFLSLLIFQSLVDYVAGLGIGRSDDERVRKRYLIGAITINLLVLATFKYFGFFVDSAIGLLRWLGLEPNPPLLEIILPIGISFYTFQSITYSFDVYRRRLPPTTSFLNYAVFVAYFPHMIAGPIQRANHLLPQIERQRTRPTVQQVRSGLFLIVMGCSRRWPLPMPSRGSQTRPSGWGATPARRPC
jgi:alginate O-acetyltransferase complex protein AlgI